MALDGILAILNGSGGHFIVDSVTNISVVHSSSFGRPREYRSCGPSGCVIAV